jgi:hypothetical protein
MFIPVLVAGFGHNVAQRPSEVVRRLAAKIDFEWRIMTEDGLLLLLY